MLLNKCSNSLRCGYAKAVKEATPFACQHNILARNRCPIEKINKETLEANPRLETVRRVSQASLLSGHKCNHHNIAFTTKVQKKFRSLVAEALQQTELLVHLNGQKVKHAARDTIRGLQNRMNSFGELFEKPQVCASATKPYSSIPGPRGIPFLGSALEYTSLGKFSPKEYHKALQHRHNRYGKIFRERLLNEEFVYVSDPKDIRLLIQNEGAAPCRPNLEAIVESRTQEGLPLGITAMQGKEWLRNRNSINPAISIPKVIKKYREPQREIAVDLVQNIKKLKNQHTGEVADFDQILNRWALESIAVVLLDTRLGLLNPDSVERNPAAEQLRECMDVFFDYGARLTFGMPTWKIWNTKDWKIFRNSQRAEFKYAGYFVEKKLKELKNKSDSNSHTAPSKPTGCPFGHQKKSQKPQNKSFTCLLDHVINNSELTKDEAVTVCLELLAGGIDTTASAAVFTLYHLAVNQDHQEHLRKLLREENIDSSADYDRENSSFSRYLKACVWESMRLNPLTYANVRTSEKDLVLSGYSVPAGTTVRYTSHLMNLENEDYFLESKKFIPERWMERSSPYRCKEQFTFTPFGHGARQCPGRRVAEQELDLLFREVLGTFKVGYKYGKMGNKVRLFNRADKPPKFDFTPL